MTNFNGHPSNVSDGVKRMIRRAADYHLYVTSTTDGTSHASTSWHYPRNNADGLGHAVDLAGTPENMRKFQRHITRDAESRKRFREVFGPVNSACVKNGALISIGEGTALETAHDNHVHVATYK